MSEENSRKLIEEKNNLLMQLTQVTCSYRFKKQGFSHE